MKYNGHRVTRSIRKILPSELPKIIDFKTRKPRAMTEQELLNADIVLINADENLYSCQDQDHEYIDEDTGERTWQPVGVVSPGVELSRGFLKDRHDSLPDDVKPHVMLARVKRKKGKSEEIVHIPHSKVKAGDVVEKQGMFPHRWHGEILG